MKKHLKYIFLLLLLNVISSYSQFYNGSNLTFGKNRVQYQKHNWVFYRGDRCDVYFYPQGKLIAQYVLKYAEEEIDILERHFGIALENKIQFLIFVNFSDFKESNIGLLSDEANNVGGQTNIISNKVILYFDRGYQEFNNSIKSGIASLFINELINGSSYLSQMRTSTLSNIPSWFQKGLVSFYYSNWDTKIDNEVRDLFTNNSFSKFNTFENDQSRIAGHAIWNYIAEKYSKNSIPSIISNYKSFRNIDRAFLYALGTNFSSILEDCSEYYINKYEIDLKREMPSNSLISKPKKNILYSHSTISNDGNSYVWTTNEMGQIKIWYKNQEMKKPKRIFKKNHKIDDNPDNSFPLINFNPNDETITFIIEEQGKHFIYNYDINTKKKSKNEVFKIDKITSFSYSHDGKLIVFSGVKDGKSDIFVYNLITRAYNPITNDIYDDFSPQFIDNSSKIIFSSNRANDTLNAKNNISREVLTSKYNLFLYNYKTKEGVLSRITNTKEAIEIYPQEINDNRFVFLSDENGIFNRYVGEFDSIMSHVDTTIHYRFFTRKAPLTDYRTSILEHSFNNKTEKYLDIILDNSINRILINSETSNQYNFQKTITDASFKINYDFKNKSIILDTLKNKIKKNPQKRLQSVKLIDAYNDAPDVVKKSGFQNFFVIQDTAKEILDNHTLTPQQLERNYFTQYSISKIVTQFDFSFLNTSYQQFSGGTNPIYLNAGFNALFLVSTQDLFEDHRITGGFRLTSSISDMEFLFSYEKLDKRIDRQIVFHRQQFKNYYDYYAEKKLSNSLYYILKYPFNNVNALKGTIIGRFDKSILLSTEDITLKEPNYYAYWSGLKIEWIFDNSRKLAENIYQGTKAKVFGEYYQSVEDKNINLFVLGADARYYYKIHKTFIWANRIAGSTSFGKNKLIYYMGGVDNWLFAKFNENINVATDQNYTFQTLATNMRGFIQNIRNGNSFAVINSELRFPAIKYFYKKPLNNEFLNSFQIVAFADIGTAWTGPSPYSDKNSFFTQIIKSGPITVTLEKQTDPLVAGYGFGLRSKLLGYFIRADWAWGVEDLNIQPRVFYLSLNLDF